MSEQCIVIGNDFLKPKYIAEDDIPRDGHRWPEYANTMMICIDSFENGLANGRLHNYYFEEIDYFSSLDQLLFSLENVMEKANMPQAAYAVRKPIPMTMKKSNGSCKMVVTAEADNSNLNRSSPYYTLETIKAIKGKLSNFYIRVYSRQYASMQGFLVDAKDRTTYAFRSELELIRFLRDLLNDKSR